MLDIKVKDNKDLLKDPEFKKYYDQFKDQEYHSLIYLKGDTNKEFRELSHRKDIDIHFVTWRGYNQRDDLGKPFVVSGTWDNIVNLFKTFPFSLRISKGPDFSSITIS